MKFYQNVQTKEIILTKTELNCNELIELLPNKVDASLEKHVPVVEIKHEKVKVCVGSVIHPMTDAHLITSIYVITSKGYYVRNLTSQEEPIITFTLNDETVDAVYEYCNLHGLWIWENK